MASTSPRRKANVLTMRPLRHSTICCLFPLSLFLTPSSSLCVGPSEPLPLLFPLSRMFFSQIPTWLDTFKSLLKCQLIVKVFTMAITPPALSPALSIPPPCSLFLCQPLIPIYPSVVCFPFLERKLWEAGIIFCVVHYETPESNKLSDTG